MSRCLQLFLKTANNEKEHAKMWFKELAGIGDTKENLAAAAEGENYEWTDMYEGFCKDRRRRRVFQNLLPNSEQSERLRSIMKKDTVHFLRISKLHRYLQKSEVKVWECRNCGHIVVGTKAPEVCPVCAHPQSYFEVHEENY